MTETKGSGSQGSPIGESSPFSELRTRVKTELPDIDVSALSAEQIQSLVHELQVHEAELQVQNQDLIEAQRELECARDAWWELFENAPVGYFVLDSGGLIRKTNQKGASLLCSEAKALTGRAFFRIVHEDDQNTFFEKNFLVARTGRREECELRMVNANGGFLYAHLAIETQANSQNKVVGLRVAVTDITSRRRAEALERDIEQQKFRLAFEYGPDAIFWADAEFGEILNCNRAAEQLLGRSRADIVGHKQTELHPPQEAEDYRSLFRRHLQDTRADAECEVLTSEGKPIPVRITAKTMEVGGRLILQGVFRDITERKAAYNKLQAALTEREILLREIHHRVKNNLGIMAALLTLESLHEGGKSVEAVCEEVRGRILAMARAHEVLYESESLGSVSAESYIGELSGNVKQSSTSQSCDIEIATKIDDIKLGLDQAVHLGLLVNELVSNCLKHAFPAQRTGRIDISLLSEQPGFLELTVRDNGVGIPDDIDLARPKSLGLELVNAFADSLHGTLNVEKQPSTTVTVRFPID